MGRHATVGLSKLGIPETAYVCTAYSYGERLIDTNSQRYHYNAYKLASAYLLQNVKALSSLNREKGIGYKKQLAVSIAARHDCVWDL